MGDVKAMFTGAQIISDLNMFIGKETAKIERAFLVIGEDIVNDAKDKPASETYTDRTTNLRNSIGSKVTNNGKEVSRSGGLNSEGSQLLDEIKPKVNIQLDIVAGMDYAAPVEAMEGHSVLSGSIPSQKQIEDKLKELL